MKALSGYVYLLILALWIGGTAFFTFVLTPVIFKAYPRDTAGTIVGTLFPVYFAFTLAVALLALFFFVVAFSNTTFYRYRFSFVLLLLSVLISLYATLFLHPEMRRVKQEVPSFETTAPDHPGRARFRALHARSAVLNVIMIANGVLLFMFGVSMKK